MNKQNEQWESKLYNDIRLLQHSNGSVFVWVKFVYRHTSRKDPLCEYVPCYEFRFSKEGVGLYEIGEPNDSFIRFWTHKERDGISLPNLFFDAFEVPRVDGKFKWDN